MRIFYDSRWIAPHGIGRVAREYRARLVRDFDVIELETGPKPSGPLDWWFLGRAFRQSGAGLLFTPGYNGTPLAGHRQLFIIHDLIHFGAREPNGRRKRLYYNSITRLAARRGSVLTVSHASARELEHRWPEVRGRIGVVPNGISEPFRSMAGDSAGRSGLVLFGNGRWHKNLDGMIAGIARWQERNGNIPVTIIGPDEPARSLADKAGLRAPVFAGRLDDAEVAALLARSAALLFCSHAEGFGLPILEAIACRCPVIASDIAVMREVGLTGCVFVDPASAEDIAGGIEVALGETVDETARKELVAAHDWDAGYAIIAERLRALAGMSGQH